MILALLPRSTCSEKGMSAPLSAPDLGLCWEIAAQCQFQHPLVLKVPVQAVRTEAGAHRDSTHPQAVAAAWLHQLSTGHWRNQSCTLGWGSKLWDSPKAGPGSQALEPRPAVASLVHRLTTQGLIQDPSPEHMEVSPREWAGTGLRVPWVPGMLLSPHTKSRPGPGTQK